jgi:hypothetical protein
MAPNKFGGRFLRLDGVRVVVDDEEKAVVVVVTLLC